MKKFLFLLGLFMMCTSLIGCVKNNDSNINDSNINDSNINDSNANITKIEYSYGGGYGDLKETTMKQITFHSDGSIILSNDYDSYTEEFSIDREEYNDLVTFINERISLFYDEIKGNDDILDGSSSYLSITLDDGTFRKVGGYMVFDNRLHEITDKIHELVSYERLNEYVDNGNWDEKYFKNRHEKRK